MSHLCPHQRLEAGFEVIDAAAVEFGHLLQQLLVLGFKVLLHGAQLLPGLRGTRGGHTPGTRILLARRPPQDYGVICLVGGQAVTSLMGPMGSFNGTWWDPWDHPMGPGGIHGIKQWNLMGPMGSFSGSWWDPNDQLIDPGGTQVTS